MARTKSKWKAFRTARRFVRSLGLKNDAEWRLYCKGALRKKGKKPEDIPTTPNIIYKDTGWINLGDWLGTGKLSNRVIRASYRNFRDARKYARSLGVKNREEWQALYRAGKIPQDIPFKPERAYAGKGWKSCGDWFGTGYVPPGDRRYREFSKARTFSRKLKVGSRREWERYCRDGLNGKSKKPEDIPATPARIYRDDGWMGWPDWLGKEVKGDGRVPPSKKRSGGSAKKNSSTAKATVSKSRSGALRKSSSASKKGKK